METLVIIWILSNGADLTTTELAIHSGAGYEANPLLEKTAVRLPLKIGVTIGGAYYFNKAHKTHPKLVKTLVLVVSGIYVGTSIHNYKVWKGRP